MWHVQMWSKSSVGKNVNLTSNCGWDMLPLPEPLRDSVSLRQQTGEKEGRASKEKLAKWRQSLAKLGRVSFKRARVQEQGLIAGSVPGVSTGGEEQETRGPPTNGQ